MRERTIIALWKRLAGGQRLQLRAVSVLVIALGSAALLMGPGMDPTARAQTTGDYDGDDDGLIEVTTVAQLNAIRWDLDGDGGVDPGGDASGYSDAFPNAVVSPLMGCATTGCVGYELTADLDLADRRGQRHGLGADRRGIVRRVHCHVRWRSAGLQSQ